MARRSYQQFCPVAASLDVVGERWSLLIVRELLFGPKRFTDLRQALPAMSPNLLAPRLKDLEEAGVVAQRELPPPAARTVYELTPSGRELEPVIRGLARWGMARLDVPAVDDDVSASVAVRGAIVPSFDARRAGDDELCYQLVVDDQPFSILVRNGTVSLRPGLVEAPDLTITASAPTLVRIRLGATTVDDALATDAVHADPPEAFERFADLFDLRHPVANLTPTS